MNMKKKRNEHSFICLTGGMYRIDLLFNFLVILLEISSKQSFFRSQMTLQKVSKDLLVVEAHLELLLARET